MLSSREVRSFFPLRRQIDELAGYRDHSAGGHNRYFCAIRDNVILELLFLTGIRIGELVALNVSDVGLENTQIHIIGRATRGRNVPLTSDASSARWRIPRPSRRPQHRTTALFVGRSGTRLTIYSIENIFKKHVRLAEIKRHITPHALRHTMAAMLVCSGADIRDVQEILGHASILSTQVYKKLTIRGKRLPAVARRSAPMAMESVVPRLPIKK